MATTERMPIAEEDYPRTWSEFMDRFASEEACGRYLERLRWPQGYTCSRCGAVGEPYRASRGRLMCRHCRYQASVTVGTIFEKTRTPLRVWLAAAWYVTNQKQGVSALGLQRVLGIGSYETAWAMLHRLRRAMVRPDRAPLNGDVEVDESYVAIRDRQVPVSKAGRQSQTTQTLVAVAVERIHPRGFGRIRLRRLARASQEYLLPFVQDSVAPGARVHTDGSAAYLPLAELGYEHRPTVLLGSARPAHEVLPGVHRIASLLQRWILGTHHGAVQPGHLDDYLDEFVFRFNRRSSRSRGLLFYRLLQQAVATDPVTYSNLIHPLQVVRIMA
ncbi:MAG: IS1595 family transposase [Steroidobacteraceae bacterium]